MKYLFFIPLILLSACTPQTQSSRLPIGRWRSEADSNYIVVFDAHNIRDSYDGDDISSTPYKITAQSCDTNYLSQENAEKNDVLFLSLEDGICYEIVTFTDSVLEYRYTRSGKLLAFRKIGE